MQLSCKKCVQAMSNLPSPEYGLNPSFGNMLSDPAPKYDDPGQKGRNALRVIKPQLVANLSNRSPNIMLAMLHLLLQFPLEELVDHMEEIAAMKKDKNRECRELGLQAFFDLNLLAKKLKRSTD